MENHEIFGMPGIYHANGFMDRPKTKYVERVVSHESINSQRFEHDNYTFDFEKHIERKLVDNLINVLLERKLVQFHKEKRYNEVNFSAAISVVDGKNEYVNFSEPHFIVDDEHFTNSELIEAVKNTFPERLI
jgi:hypothetical protein